MKKLISKWLMGNVVEKHTTKADFNKVIETLSEVIKDNSFGIVASHDMRETYTSKNLAVADDFEYRIIHLCNAPKSHKALTELSFDMGVMMPKTIIVAREDGGTSLRFMKMKPWMVSMMFPEIDIVPLSKKVTGTMEKIVKETIKKVDNK